MVIWCFYANELLFDWRVALHSQLIRFRLAASLNSVKRLIWDVKHLRCQSALLCKDEYIPVIRWRLWMLLKYLHEDEYDTQANVSRIEFGYIVASVSASSSQNWSFNSYLIWSGANGCPVVSKRSHFAHFSRKKDHFDCIWYEYSHFFH